MSCYYWLVPLNACCCFDLRRGSFIILWFSLIFWTVLAILIVALGDSVLPHLIAQITLAVNGVLMGSIPALMGLYGAYMNQPDYLLPFICTTIVHIILWFESALIICILIITDEEELKYQTVDLIVVFILIILYLVFWYLMNVVRNFYLRLRDENCSQEQNTGQSKE